MSRQVAGLAALLMVAEMAQSNYQQLLGGMDGPEYTMSAKAFVREFRTIHLNIGRRSGKSSLIAELATPRDVVVVANTRRIPLIKSYLPWVITADTVNRMDPSSATLERVWVDEPSDVFHIVTRDLLYRNLVNSHATTVVMLGE